MVNYEKVGRARYNLFVQIAENMWQNLRLFATPKGNLLAILNISVYLWFAAPVFSNLNLGNLLSGVADEGR